MKKTTRTPSATAAASAAADRAAALASVPTAADLAAKRAARAASAAANLAAAGQCNPETAAAAMRAARAAASLAASGQSEPAITASAHAAALVAERAAERASAESILARQSASAAADGAAVPVWECKIDPCNVKSGLPVDKGANGAEMFFKPGDDIHEPGPLPAPVRLVFSATVCPSYLFQSGGRWHLSFGLAECGPASPMFAVECGEESGLTLENAMALFFHPAAPAAD